MSHLPRITIVMPSFNQACFLEQAIRSVLEQGYPHLQFGIVDGGSTDGSAQIIQRYRDRLDFAVIEPDRGQAQAINKGLRRAQGEVVGWLCSDDLLLPGALHTVGRWFADHPESDWAAGACHVIDADGRVLEVSQPSGRFTLAGVLLRSERQRFNLPQPSVFWRRSLHEQVGYLDESLHYCMDFEFWLRLIRSSRWPTLLDAALAAYRLHGTSKSCAQAAGFLREHVTVEGAYSRDLSWPQRLELRRRLGYMRRACAIHEAGGHLPWGAVVRRPWWLLSQQVRQALWQNGRAAA